MDNLNKIPSGIDDNEEPDNTGEDSFEEVREKSETVKTIESFDIENLTPENIEFMTNTVQDYFRENFPADPGMIDLIPEHILLVEDEEFKRIYYEEGEDDGVDINEKTGFYNSTFHRMLINISSCETPAKLFAVMFHESLHFVSIENGAGFDGVFWQPDEIGEDKEKSAELNKGISTLKEGTTQFITIASVIDDMGFDDQDGIADVYEPEWSIMENVWRPFGRRNMLHAYFETSIDDLRRQVEKMFEPDETREKFSDKNYCNGVFSYCLVDLGVATENLTEAMVNWKEGEDNPMVETLKDVKLAVGHYIKRDCEVNNIEIDDGIAEELEDYLGQKKEE